LNRSAAISTHELQTGNDGVLDGRAAAPFQALNI
jgi:hypothetical protein